MKEQTKKAVFVSLGFICVGFGITGVFLPLLPTTPFALLAAYFFSKGSKRCHEWLISHAILGELILAWEEDKSITLKTKIIATLMIIICFSFSLIYLQIPFYAKVILVITGISVILFINTRKTRRV
jgi:uncharacterized membrane protein YbaN (DUF454 family)